MDGQNIPPSTDSTAQIPIFDHNISVSPDSIPQTIKDNHSIPPPPDSTAHVPNIDEIIPLPPESTCQITKVPSCGIEETPSAEDTHSIHPDSAGVSRSEVLFNRGRAGCCQFRQKQTALSQGESNRSSPPDRKLRGKQTRNNCGNCWSTKTNSTLRRERKKRTTLLTLVILTLGVCSMNLPFTLYMIWCGSLKTLEDKVDLFHSPYGSVPIVLVGTQTALNPYVYLF
ncbi:hypothetical protein EGW08_012238, partial [Elysia chlorotica]